MKTRRIDMRPFKDAALGMCQMAQAHKNDFRVLNNAMYDLSGDSDVLYAVREAVGAARHIASWQDGRRPEEALLGVPERQNPNAGAAKAMRKIFERSKTLEHLALHTKTLANFRSRWLSTLKPEGQAAFARVENILESLSQQAQDAITMLREQSADQIATHIRRQFKEMWEGGLKEQVAAIAAQAHTLALVAKEAGINMAESDMLYEYTAFHAGVMEAVAENEALAILLNRKGGARKIIYDDYFAHYNPDMGAEERKQAHANFAIFDEKSAPSLMQHFAGALSYMSNRRDLFSGDPSLMLCAQGARSMLGCVFDKGDVQEQENVAARLQELEKRGYNEQQLKQDIVRINETMKPLMLQMMCLKAVVDAQSLKRVRG